MKSPTFRLMAALLQLCPFFADYDSTIFCRGDRPVAPTLCKSKHVLSIYFCRVCQYG